MKIELNDTETSVLSHALEVYLSNLRVEIGRTKKRDWKTGLRQERDTLNGIMSRMN